MTGPVRNWAFLGLLALGLIPGLAMSVPARAVAVDAEALQDPATDSRARALAKELRCLVCQNQSIEDSDADLARDLRRIVRERIKAGDSDEAIKGFLVDRYGDWVLMRPPMKPETYLLWITPFLLLGAGGVSLYLRRRQPEGAPLAGADPAPLDAAEEDRLARLTGRDPA